jgi:hypothetical protein
MRGFVKNFSNCVADGKLEANPEPRKKPVAVAPAQAVAGVQLRMVTELTGEQYVTRRAWRDASLERCPVHPGGGCGFKSPASSRRVFTGSQGADIDMQAYTLSIIAVLALCLLSIILAIYSGSSKGRAGALCGPVLPGRRACRAGDDGWRWADHIGRADMGPCRDPANRPDPDGWSRANAWSWDVS